MSSKTLLSAPSGVNGTSRLKRLFLGRKRPRLSFWEHLLSEAHFPRISLLGISVNRGNPLLPQHVGSRLTKSLPSASTPC